MNIVCGSEWCPKWKECGRAVDNHVGRYAQIENWATYGSVVTGLDANGKTFFEEHTDCGPSGKYAMFIPKQQ